jgi:16S rRNA (cytidine1402-2'-O)-methyltransferase
VVSDSRAATPGTLHIVSTPIGNLGDFTVRAVEVLRGVAAVLAEDTRHSRTLLDRYDVRTPMIAYHEHNEAKATPGLVRRLLEGESFALVTDAGTPLVSDPGSRLVRAAIDAGVPVTPVPGPSAALAALVASGLPAERFSFLGFLPRKGGERREGIAGLATLAHTAILYEAPSRLGDTLADLAAAGLGGRPAVVARELTKTFEEFRRGTVAELAAYHEAHPPKGEVVLLVGGAPPVLVDEDALRKEAARLRSTGMSARDIVHVLMESAHAPRNLAYRIAHE